MKAMPFVKGCCRQLILFWQRNCRWITSLLPSGYCKLQLSFWQGHCTGDHFCQVATATCIFPFVKGALLFLLPRQLCFPFWQGSFAFPFGKGVLLFLLARKFCFSFWKGSFAVPFAKAALLSFLPRKLCFSFIHHRPGSPCNVIVQFGSTGIWSKIRSSVFLGDEVETNMPATWRHLLLIPPLGVEGAEDQVLSIKIVPLSVGSSCSAGFSLSYLNKSSSARKDLIWSRMKSTWFCSKTP